MGYGACSRLPRLAEPPAWLADGSPLPGYDFFGTLGPQFLSIGTGDSVSLDSVTTLSRNAQRSS